MTKLPYIQRQLAMEEESRNEYSWGRMESFDFFPNGPTGTTAQVLLKRRLEGFFPMHRCQTANDG
jgi:hypothetical protein